MNGSQYVPGNNSPLKPMVELAIELGTSWSPHNDITTESNAGQTG
jgi:hypothetical protein